jgi:hypothetical protein
MRNLIRHILKEEVGDTKLKLVKSIIYDMFDNVIDLEYNSKDNEIMVYYDKQKKLEISEICDTINDYTNLNVVPWFEYDKNRIGKEPDFYLDVDDYDEAINENYSPAGKEIIPNKIVIHKSNPKFRDKIIEQGLKASAGECYKIYAGYGEKCIPAIFATNSTNKRSWFDSTYDDDVWAINTELMPNVKWYKDRHFESSKKHIVTFDNIPSEAIELMREGTGKDMIRESSENKDMDNDIEKNLKVIRMLLKQISWGGICDIWVEYNPVDKDYEIRSKSIRRDYYLPQNVIDEIVEELNFVEESIKAMGLRPYIFSTLYVEDCEDEVKFMNESINKSDEKRNKIIEKIMDDIIFPEYNHIICGYDVKNDDVFNEPVVNVTFIGGYGTKFWPVTQGIQKMYRNILDEIWDTIYDYINIPVGVTMKTTTKCNEKENIYLRESVDKSEDKKLKLVTKMIHEFFDEVSFIDIKKYENKPMIRVYFDNDEEAGNEETYFAEQIQDKIYEYTGIKLIPYWHNIQYNTDADFRLDAIKLKYDNEGNVINESEENKKEKKFNRLIQNVEDYLNSNEYPSVKRFTVYYEDTHDDVIVNIFFDAEEAVKLGGGINSVIKKVGKQVMSDLEIFPLDFKYYTHFDKGINESEEKQPKYLNIIKNLIEPFKEEEDCVCDIRVTSEDDFYIIYLVFGTEELNDKFFSFVGRAEYTRNLRNNVKNAITDYLPINNLYVGSISKPNCEWSPLNESENKKQSLLNTIEKEGLYNFIEMSGLDISQISSVLKNMNKPRKVLKQYIRDFVLIHGYKWGDNSGILSGYEIEVSKNKYVDDIMVQDSDQIAVEILEFDIDEYGHTEQNDQYITTINNLTNEELLSIVAWMTETIKNGEWN